jgi:hypothetical protein
MMKLNRDVDPWAIYHALLESRSSLSRRGVR